MLLQILRYLTLPLAIPYGLIVALRNKLYDWKLSDSLQFNLPIINVGNLSVGGTGKTPHTEYLIELLQDTYQVATLSRGYGRYTRGFILAAEGINARDIGDEPMQFFTKFPHISVCVCEDRILAVPQLKQRKPYTQVLLLDDAFQHRSIAPSLNILLTDFSKPYTKDYILPFGNLREFRSGAIRADIIVVTKCPHELTEAQAAVITKEINATEHQQVFFSTLAHGEAYSANTGEKTSLKGKQILLVSGIANNAALVAYLKQEADMVHVLKYKDHYYYNTDDVQDILETFGNMPKGNNILLCTEKDFTRLALHQNLFTQANIALHVLPVKISFLFNAASQFERLILQHILLYYPILEQHEYNYGQTKQYQDQEGKD
ncbi:MAG: tetraacyldisaccharide 4-kinase [Bacteroidota bacterium]